MPDGATFYRNGKELRPYLKCTYGSGPFSDEYFIDFTTTESRIEETPPFYSVQDGKPIITPNGFRNNMFVQEDDIIRLKDNKGLVKLFGFEKIDEGNCLVLIRDSAEGNIPSQRNVPDSEIVWR